MNIVELFLLAVGLSMDAFAVSICKGLAMPKLTVKSMLIVGLWFGGFQALMPLIGYFLGNAFEGYITALDHWIAFILLGFIGVNMIREALGDDEEKQDASLGVKIMLTLAIATSIDALAVGVTLGLLPNINIWAAISFIGLTTFALSAIAVAVGHVFGLRYKRKAELAGGIILIGIGVKILLEHLGMF